MKWLFVLMVACSGASGMEVSDALSGATWWPVPGHAEPHEQLREYRHDGRHHGRQNCPPAVPIPGAAWLFGSAVAGLAVIKRRV